MECSPATVRNDTWQEFVEIRTDLDAVLARLLAEALQHGLDEPGGSVLVGRVIGALRMSLALPGSRGAGEILRHRLKDAHAINRRGGHPCGCGKLNACAVEGVDARSLLEALACDDALDLDEWQIDVALDGLQPRPRPFGAV